ncbi:MAG: glutamate--tRNA ligase, partial [Planctomycetes bacterium]|nr:glutamate--tRNA ligase [Planctomycetota bacterium]
MDEKGPFQGVRVRIAPSPTGDPHVGTASMTLFNYVFAKRHGGKFVLRIEDTDLTRSTRESEEAIFRELRWFGLKWDEGPDVGGPYAPYRQSERVDIYKQHARQLVDKGEAYHCFCTPERLEQVRKAQQAAKQNPAYDGQCRRLPREDAEARVKAGERHVIRLAVPDDGETTFSDRLRGNITFPNAQIDDQVLLKSDGFPTYHLANVVDDHLMKISHVIRAEEWLSSTPKHVLLYKAFGWDMPTFVHMPILRNPKRGKISKRDGVDYFAISFYRKQGYLPEALANFLGLMGGSLESGEEVFDVDTMARGFSWDRVKTTAPVFDLEKLEWLNGVYIRSLTPDQLTDRLLAGYTKRTAEDRVRLVKIAPLVKERLKTLSEFDDMTT